MKKKNENNVKNSKITSKIASKNSKQASKKGVVYIKIASKQAKRGWYIAKQQASKQ